MRIVWKLEISGYNDKGGIDHSDLEDVDLNEIARLITEGNTSGILDKEDEEE